MKSLHQKLLLVLWCSIPFSAQAFKLTIANRNCTGGFELSCTTLADNLENQFNSSIASVSNQELFLKEVGNANAVSSRSFLSPGMVTADHNFFMAVSGGGGLSLGSGASLSSGISFPQNQLPPIGIGAKTGVTLGISAKRFPSILPLDPSRLMYSASFSSMDLSSLIGRGVTLKSMQASLGMSYQAYLPQSWSPLIRFQGFRVTSALSYSSFDASYSTPFNLTQSSGGVDMTWNNNVNIGVSSSVFSLSNEVSTGIRLLWILNLYTGVGADLNLGSSKLTGGSTGPVTAATNPGGVQVFTGDAVVDGDSTGTAPTWVNFRYFLGTGFDLGPIGFYVQGQVSTPSIYGLNFGAHFML